MFARGWLWSLLVTVPLAAAEPIYTAPDELPTPLTAEQVASRAQAYLAEHPHSPAAARAALDLWLAAAALNDESRAERAQAFLLLDQPVSLRAGFVTAAFKEDEAFVKLLARDFARRDRDLTADYLHKFVEAAVRAPGKFQKHFNKNDKFAVALAWAFAARTNKDGGIEWQKHVSADALKIIKASQNDLLDRGGHFLALQEWPKNEVAQAIQRSLFQRMQGRERTPEIIAVQVENLTFAGCGEDALALLEVIPTEKQDARVRYWKALALASVGKHEDAVAALEPAANDVAENEWVVGAAKLCPLLKAQPAAVEELPAVLLSVLEQLRRSPPTVLEFVLRSGENEKIRQEFYAAYHSKQSLVEFVYRRADEVKFAYRSEGTSARLFAPDAQVIREFSGGRMRPDFRWNMRESPTGMMDFSFGFNLTSEARDGLGDLLDPLRTHPVTQDETSLLRLLAGNTGRTILTPVETRDGEKRFSVLTQERGSPNLSPLHVRVAGGKLIGVTGDDFAVERLRYGAAGEFALEPPAWPDLPVETKAHSDAGDIGLILSAAAKVLELWSEEPEAAK